MDNGNHRVQVYTNVSDPTYLTTIGKTNSSGTFIRTSSATDNTGFDSPQGVALDSAGKLYVSDLIDDRIQVYEWTEEVVTITNTND